MDDLLGLFLGITLRNKIGFSICSGKLLQRLRKDVGGEPSALGQRFAERTVLLDHTVDVGAEVLGGSLQRVLEDLTAHTGVDHRVPVHKLDLSGGDCLGQLIHSLRGLSGTRTGNSRKVGDTLDRIHRCLKINTGSRKGADVSRHLREVIDGLVGICVQRVEC